MNRVKFHEVRMQAWLCAFYLTPGQPECEWSGCAPESLQDYSRIAPARSLIAPWSLRARTALLRVRSGLLREPKAALSWAENGKGRSRGFRRYVSYKHLYATFFCEPLWISYYGSAAFVRVARDCSRSDQGTSFNAPGHALWRPSLLQELPE